MSDYAQIDHMQRNECVYVIAVYQTLLIWWNTDITIPVTDILWTKRSTSIIIETTI